MDDKGRLERQLVNEIERVEGCGREVGLSVRWVEEVDIEPETRQSNNCVRSTALVLGLAEGREILLGPKPDGVVDVAVAAENDRGLGQRIEVIRRVPGDRPAVKMAEVEVALSDLAVEETEIPPRDFEVGGGI